MLVGKNNPQINKLQGKTRWWFAIFVDFIPTWGDDPIRQIFLKWVETTN